jgi:NADH-quinone oxidoreductase subunit I
MYGTGLLKGLGVTLKHTFEKEITQQYPEQIPVLPKRFRGSLQFEFQDCIACGMCAKVCPNGVISLESARDEKTGKKKLISYTIDFQYCMYCNFCVENCPKHCLYFDHNFELAAYYRDNIKTVYQRPQELVADLPEEISAAAEKKQKQINVMINALQKDAPKILGKLLEDEAKGKILATVLAADQDKLEIIAEMMIEDIEKAKKIAGALANKASKEHPEEGNVVA